MLSLVVCLALAGERWIQNDNFSGSGTVNSAVSFGEYEGPAVLFSPDGGYPLTIKAIDVLSVTYNQGSPGAIAGYQIDIWDERDGLVDPPRLADAGQYPPRVRLFRQFTTSSSSFNRVDLVPPLVLDGGRLFVSIGEQLSTAFDNATVAIDTAPLVPGANWYRESVGVFTRIDRPDGGFYRGINHNWIIRAVVDTPDLPVTVTSIFPDRGPATMPTSVVISGMNFSITAQVYVGSQLLAVTGRSGTSTINATVPAGLAPGPYTVRVENSATNFGTLPNGYTVLTSDGGMGGAGGGAGTGGGAGGGSTGGGSGGAGGSGGTGGSGGGTTAVLRIDDITPNEGDNASVTKVVVTGDGFQTGAQVIIGTTVLDSVTVRSAAVINADVPAGLSPGDHDVVVINLDGSRDTLRNGFTATVATKSGCGCGFSGLEPLLLLGLLPRLRRRAAVTRGGPQHAEGPPRP